MKDGVVSVTAAVLVRKGRVLVCQRAPGAAHAGKWEFPGGKVEPGEGLEECMRRELREELGIEVRVGRSLWRTRHQYPDREPVQLTFFLIHPEFGGELDNRVFADVRWVPISTLAEIDFLDGDRERGAAIERGEVSLVWGDAPTL